MDIFTLENRISSHLPIYYGDKVVEVIEIYDDFGLVEINWIDGEKNFVVDIKTLSEKPSEEISISLSLFKNRMEG